MMFVLVPLAVSQTAPKKDAAADTGTLRQAADTMGFWVGTTIQGRMWNHDPEYKPVLAREFNAAVSIVFQGITQPERGRFNFEIFEQAAAARTNSLASPAIGLWFTYYRFYPLPVDDAQASQYPLTLSGKLYGKKRINEHAIEIGSHTACRRQCGESKDSAPPASRPRIHS